MPPVVPYMPPTFLTLDPARFDQLIYTNGVRLWWMKNHNCPCTYGGPTPGSPDPSCETCKGRGVYWDDPVGPIIGLITFIHTSPTPDEPGAIMNEDEGLAMNGEPALTIGYSTASGIWDEAGLFDQFVEYDTTSRMQINLIKGSQETIVYANNLYVPASGAVTLYDAVNKRVITNASYTVSGVQVLLSSGYPDGTPFTVSFYAAPSYVAYRQAGAPAHIRPFGAGLKEPRRYRLQLLDYWLRQRNSTDVPYVTSGQ